MDIDKKVRKFSKQQQRQKNGHVKRTQESPEGSRSWEPGSNTIKCPRIETQVPRKDLNIRESILALIPSIGWDEKGI